MARKRKSIKPQVQAGCVEQCRRRCCVCFALNKDPSEKRGQIAHLDRDPSNNDPDNLVFLCMDHHDQYDSKTSQSKNLTQAEVRKYRSDLLEAIAGGRLPQGPTKIIRFAELGNTHLSQNIVGNDNITNQTVNINVPRPQGRGSKAAVHVLPPPGAIASDLNKRNYILHLIKRYIEFKNKDTKGKGFRPVIYKTIERRFGAKWDMVPLARFEALAEYLKDRIDRSIMGKNNTRKGHKNYSSFDDPRWQGS